jgi:secretory carrier-associated membrane protein
MFLCSDYDNPFADPSHSRENPFDDPVIRSGQAQHRVYDDDLDDSTLDLPELPHRGDDMSERLREIQEREAKLAEREQTVVEAERKAAYIRKYGRNNWPPFYPILYHDIDEEITTEVGKRTVRTLYRLWQLLLIVLLLNMVAGILLLTSGQSDGAKDLISSIVYLPVIGCLSFLLWYRCVTRPCVEVVQSWCSDGVGTAPSTTAT